MDENRQDRRGQQRRQRRVPDRRKPADDAGFSMIATVLALVVVALGAALLLGTTLHSSGGSSTGVANAPGVALADRVQAQQSLSTGLTAAETAAASAGGFATVTASDLEASNPSITFIAGPSSGATTVSVAVSAEGTGGAAAGDQSTGVAGIPDIPGVTGGGGANGGASSGGNAGGSITLTDRSSDGVCWLVWKAGATATWYGAQTGLASCTAPSLSAAPTPGPVSSAAIGWQQGSFPSP
jgi:type II secretory pathway pseudopilin PulG